MQKIIPIQEQQQALEQIKGFLTGDNDVFILHGYAGTGKTTMIKWICDHLSQNFNVNAQTDHKPFYVLTPTGRAARVLKNKEIDARTIHSLIYSPELICLETTNNDYSQKKCEYVFPLEEIPECTKVLIVDESSMIGDSVTHTEFLKFGSGRLLTDLLIYRSVALNNTIDKNLFINNESNINTLNETIKQFNASKTNDKRCKIIFVGDDAQLPPIGENFSRAMSANHLSSLGLKVEEAFLTTVLRQNEQSGILKTSINIRTLLESSKRTSLKIEDNGYDITEVLPCDMISRYVSMYPQPEVGDSVVVCHSNKQCYQYNMAIRENYFPNTEKEQSFDSVTDMVIPLQVGDILLNNKNIFIENHGRVYNGDMCVVTSVGERVTHSQIPVTIDGNKRHIDLHFREVELFFPDYGQNIPAFVIENLLFSKDRSLSVWEMRALYIDFCMRVKKSHPQIKEGTPEFKLALQSDPYTNALQMKFGYAITCHKAQGGEWRNVFVDYTGQCGLSDFQLKWCYTATTRAKKQLFVINPPKINGFSKLSFSDITSISKSPKNFFDQSLKIPEAETPYHPADALIGTKLKYLSIQAHLKNSDFKIEKVTRHNYQDVYTFSNQAGTNMPSVALYYDGEGVFKKAKFPPGTDIDGAIEQCVNATPPLPYTSNYSPSSETLEMLYQLMCSACNELDITITNIDEQLQQYYVTYNLITDARYACIQFYISNDRLTKAMPKSEQGKNDEKLIQLVNLIKTTYNA